MSLARGQITITAQQDGKYIVAEYSLGLSGTIAPATGWQKSPLSPKANEYLWQRTGIVEPPATYPSKWETPFLVGNNGKDAIVYELVPSTTSIKKSFAGVVTPASVTCAVYKKVGNSTAVPTTEVTLKYQRSTDANPILYAGAVFVGASEWIEFTCWQGAVLLDIQTIRVLTDASDMEIGGRNLVLKSDVPVIKTTTPHATIYSPYDMSVSWDKLSGKTITISFDYEYSGNGSANSINRIGIEPQLLVNGSIYYFGAWFRPTNASGSGRHTETLTVPIHTTTDKTFPAYIQRIGTGKISNIQIEVGNVATAWKPAPEDSVTTTEYSAFVEKTDKAITERLIKTVYNAEQKIIKDNILEIQKTATGITTTITESTKAQEAVNTKLELENLARKAMTSGKCLHPDACFTNGLNGVNPYGGHNPNTLAVNRIKDTSSPTGSNYIIRVNSVGNTGAPGRGGVYQVWVARANAVFIQRIVARIPVGFRIQEHYNNQGVGAKFQWLTPQIGTGDWCEYIGCRTCGSVQGTSVFSTGGHVAIYGGAPNVPLEWDIALMTSYDATGVGHLVDNASLNTTKTELETKITATANGLTTKVEKTAYDSNNIAINNRFSTVEQTANQISSKVSQTDFDNRNNVVDTKFTEVTQTADSISLKVNAPQGIRNYAIGTEKPFTATGYPSKENFCYEIYKIRKEVTGGDVCLAFDIELAGCTFTSNSMIDFQGDGNWDWNLGVSGWDAVPLVNGKYHVFLTGNIPTKAVDGGLWIRLDYVVGGTITITNAVYTKGHKEIDWSQAPEDFEAKMVSTGIDVENGVIRFTSNNTTFQDNNGNQIALFNSKGINADLINTKELSFERLICYNNSGEKLYSVNEVGDGCPKFYYPNGVVMKEDAFIYDDSGNINGVETRYYDASGTLKWKTSDTGAIVTIADITCGWTVLNSYYLSQPPTSDEIKYLKQRDRINSNTIISKFYTTDANEDLGLELDYNNRFCFGAKTNQNATSIPSNQWVTGYILDDKTNYRGDDIWKNPPIIALRIRYLRRYENGKHISSKDIHII